MSGKFKSARSQSLGKIVSSQQVKSGLIGKTDHGQFRVQFYNEFIVRISVTREEDFEDFSYAVVAEPTNTEITFHESDDALNLSTGKFTARISKNQARFQFQNHEGKIINEDDPGFGTSWNGEQVTTYKK